MITSSASSSPARSRAARPESLPTIACRPAVGDSAARGSAMLTSGGTGRPGGAGDRSHDGLLDVLPGVLVDDELACVVTQPQHHDPVGNPHEVGQVVGDQDHAESLVTQLFDKAKHLVG